MKSKEEYDTVKWMLNKGFSNNYIEHTINIFEKEGISFSIKTMNSFSLKELKEGFEYFDRKDNEDFIKEILSDMKGFNIKESIKQLCH
jgi:hypothetical protein